MGQKESNSQKMSLKSTAETDAGIILNDDVYGFGCSITLIDPSDLSIDLVGFSNDIHELIDPDPGQSVSSRRASVALYIRDIESNDVILPYNIPESDSRPYRMKFIDSNNHEHEFKVIEAHPDRGLGIITCLLGLYKSC